MEKKDDKSFVRDIIVLISFPILFVSTSFLVNIGIEMSLPGFRASMLPFFFFFFFFFFVVVVVFFCFYFVFPSEAITQLHVRIKLKFNCI